MCIRDRAAEAKEPMDVLCRYFQRGMWNLLLAFKPDVVILGGGVMENYYFLAADLLRRLAAGREDFLEDFEILPAGQEDVYKRQGKSTGEQLFQSCVWQDTTTLSASSMKTA